MHWLLIQWCENEKDRKSTEKAGIKTLEEWKAKSLLFQLTEGRLLYDLSIKLMGEGAIRRVYDNPCSKQISSSLGFTVNTGRRNGLHVSWSEQHTLSGARQRRKLIAVQIF